MVYGQEMNTVEIEPFGIGPLPSTNESLGVYDNNGNAI